MSVYNLPDHFNPGLGSRIINSAAVVYSVLPSWKEKNIQLDFILYSSGFILHRFDIFFHSESICQFYSQLFT